MLGSLERGLALLDEAMVRILTRTTSPRATSIVYCAAIGSCYEVHELARAAEWSGDLVDLHDWYSRNAVISNAANAGHWS